jgi:diguanylate cyclase (GGDEF)-like protein/PAS domain S-box-containing protein
VVDPVSSGRRLDGAALAELWAATLAPLAGENSTPAVASQRLTWAAAQLAHAVAAEPVDLDTAKVAGAALVDTGLLVPQALPAAIAGVLALVEGPFPAEVEGALIEGYLTRLAIYRQQEAQSGELRDLEEQLRSMNSRFQAVFTNAGVGIGIADMQGGIVDVNTSFAAMLGYTVEEFHTLQVGDFVYFDDMWDMYQPLIAGECDIVRIETKYKHRQGHVVWTDLRASLIRDATGIPTHTVAIVEDISARRELQDRLRWQALHDPLTLLPNRAFFQERLNAAFARPGSRVGVCYLDLDRFKAINDRLGHDVGDELLLAMASRLDGCVSARGHLVVRMGGDEFVILVEDPPRDELAALAEAILLAVSRAITVGGHTFEVSASIGVVECGVDAMTPAEVLKAADVTLYWAKSDGRNRWVRFDPARYARDMIRYTLSANLLPGLERGEFRVEYQPIVRLADGSVAGVEALVRWAHPTLGRLGPDQFIDLAEETGSIVPLGRHVLLEACERAAAWNAVHRASDLFVSVNLAVRQAQEPNLVDDVARILAKTGLAPNLLHLELTESALLGPMGRPVDAINALARMGIRIAVDDFGTGYSNLGYLPRLPLHTIKLAGLFMEGLHKTTDAIVTSLISLAHDLKLSVTAEGVETPAQAKRLTAAGCDTAQGWLYALPAPWEEVVDLLEFRFPTHG